MSPSYLTSCWLLAEECWFSNTWCHLQDASWGLFTGDSNLRKDSSSKFRICTISPPSPSFKQSNLKSSPVLRVRQDIPLLDERHWEGLSPFCQSTRAYVGLIQPSGLVFLQVSLADNRKDENPRNGPMSTSARTKGKRASSPLAQALNNVSIKM